MREFNLTRTTNESDIFLKLNLDGEGTSTIETGIGFLDHMLILMTRHGLFNLDITCNGDLHVDYHHTVEDVGIVLGKAFSQCIGNKEGINRYAHAVTPMDDALSSVTVDISGRPYLVYQVEGLKDKVGNFDTELVEEFFQAFVNHAQINLHITLSYGKNSHHIIESIFKGFGRALDEASRKNPRIIGVPSTKGSL
ncbi:imidazoleglycerol-phosphate dehydratase HisB [Ornithinibacillus scapharcae]|uniref:imidazoleglycerol-phosphate dehydratase HisB n=1 Tax=Ornithinibacillus scapharcae TaxID=1147159 RepID=UPI000225BF3E|nr:imidazoleglycerol-phosphate dehydratase HisB [Ornithinibacillus scapharcae]